VDWKRVLGLALTSVTLALVVWGLFFAKPPVKWTMPFRVGIVNEPATPR
jgi:hypothetical protein